MILSRQAVQTFCRYTLHRNLTPFQHFKQFAGKFSLQLALYKNFIYFLIGLNSLDHGTYAEYHFVFFHQIYINCMLSIECECKYTNIIFCFDVPSRLE